MIISLEQITANFEIILVNDASPYADWEIIQHLASSDSRIKGINFSRNFGQHHAITAGIDYADGDWVVVMDADLQDQPEEILKLYNKAQEGYDIVFGQRLDRQDSKFKIFCSHAFNRLYNSLSDLSFDPSIANFSIISRQVAAQWRTLRESSRAYGLTLLWCGFNVAKNTGGTHRAFCRNFCLYLTSLNSACDYGDHFVFR